MIAGTRAPRGAKKAAEADNEFTQSFKAAALDAQLRLSMVLFAKSYLSDAYLSVEARPRGELGGRTQYGLFAKKDLPGSIL